MTNFKNKLTKKNIGKNVNIFLPWLKVINDVLLTTFLSISYLCVVTIVVLGGRLPGALVEAPAAEALLAVVAVVVAGLGVLLQFFGQVRAGRCGRDVVLKAVLRDLQLLHKAHGPEEKDRVRPGSSFRPV